MNRRRRSGPDQGPLPLRASLDALTSGRQLDGTISLAKLFGAWPAIVGQAMADHVTPVRIDDEVLVLAADHPAWATQARRFGQQLLERVAEEPGLPRPARVEVRIQR